MKILLKVSIFVILVGVFWYFGGFDKSKERSMRRLHSAITTVYVVGAVIALWKGDEPIGDLHPISLRPIFITVGTLLMIAAFAAMMTTRNEREKRAAMPEPNLEMFAG